MLDAGSDGPVELLIGILRFDGIGLLMERVGVALLGGYVLEEVVEGGLVEAVVDAMQEVSGVYQEHRAS